MVPLFMHEQIAPFVFIVNNTSRLVLSLQMHTIKFKVWLHGMLNSHVRNTILFDYIIELAEPTTLLVFWSIG